MWYVHILVLVSLVYGPSQRLYALILRNTLLSSLIVFVCNMWILRCDKLRAQKMPVMGQGVGDVAKRRTT